MAAPQRTEAAQEFVITDSMCPHVTTETDGGQTPHGTAPAHLLYEMLHERREDESAHASPAHGYPSGQSSPGGEVGLGSHHPGDVHGAKAQAGHQAVADQQLGHVVSVAGAQQAQAGQEGAGDTDRPRPVPSDEAGHQGAAGQVDGYLDTSHWGHAKITLLHLCLERLHEHPEGISNPVQCEGCEEASEDD